MMSRSLLAFLVVPALAAVVQADEAMSRGKAETLVQDAFDFGKANGREKLVREINLAQGRFHTSIPNNVYLVVYDGKGKVAAHGLDSKHLQMGHLNYPELKAMADKNVKGWHEYSVPNPRGGKASNFGVAYALLQDDLITSTIRLP